MLFTPVDMDNLESNLWKEGAYKFRVLDACENNQYGPQLQLDLELVENNRTKKLRTWLGATTKEGKPDLRLMFFCRSVGLIDRYKSGEILDGDCMHKQGYLQIGVGNTKNGDKVNTVQKFLSADEFEKVRNRHNDLGQQSNVVKPQQFDNDDIPF